MSKKYSQTKVRKLVEVLEMYIGLDQMCDTEEALQVMQALADLKGEPQDEIQ